MNEKGKESKKLSDKENEKGNKALVKYVIFAIPWGIFCYLTQMKASVFIIVALVVFFILLVAEFSRVE